MRKLERSEGGTPIMDHKGFVGGQEGIDLKAD